MNNYKDVFPILIKYKWVFLAVIVILGIVLRMYGISLPLVDSHQIRQAQTAMMTRNLYEDGMNIFLTRLDIFGNVPGHIILEFPLMHCITALLYYLFGVQDVIGRLVSVAFSIGAMFLMYGLARYFLSRAGAFAALALYAFSPMNIYFSRAFMPESSMMFFMIGSVFFLLKWLNKQTLPLYLTAIIFAACTGLAKPTAGLIFIPLFTIWFLKYGWGLFRRSDFWLYILLTTMPLILWAAYANYFNSKIPYCTFGFADSWIDILKTRGVIKHWLSPRLYTFIGGSIILLLLTPLGFIGAATGILLSGANDKRKILYSWLLAIIIYFYVLAEPNSTHIYYHLPLLPLAVIFFGFTIEWIFKKHKFFKEALKRKSFVWLSVGLGFLVLLGYGIGFYKYFQYMYSDRMPYVLEISELINKNTPGNRFIIDNESGLLTSVISYYSHSKAQPFTVSNRAIAELEYLRSCGATTFVTMETAYGSNIQVTKEHKDFWHYLNKNYKPLAITEHYHIFDLRTTLKGDK